MTPELYKECLDFISLRDDLEKTELHPVMLADIMTLEEELGAELPNQYEDFITEVGVGEEYGGLSKWLVLDLTVEDNIINLNEEIRNGDVEYNKYKAPKNFFAFYDQRDGIFIGFQKFKNSGFDERVSAWDAETGKLEVIADCFNDWLEENLDCDIEEYEQFITKEHQLPVVEEVEIV